MTKDTNLIPGAIILAGLVLSFTIFFLREDARPTLPEGDITKVLPVGPQDHVRGDESPRVTLITYTDLECEFCKRFHEVTEQLLAEYGTEGGVAFVVRHFPIIDLHPHASTHAKAAECAAHLGGEGMFWNFITALHALTPQSGQVDPRDYPSLAQGLGIDAGALTACVNETTFDDRVARDFENGLMIGVKGTPFSVVVVEGMEPFAVSGFLPHDALKTILDRTLSSAP